MYPQFLKVNILIDSIFSIVFYAIYWHLCFQLAHWSFANCENIYLYTSSHYHYWIKNMNQQPLKKHITLFISLIKSCVLLCVILYISILHSLISQFWRKNIDMRIDIFQNAMLLINSRDIIHYGNCSATQNWYPGYWGPFYYLGVIG